MPNCDFEGDANLNFETLIKRGLMDVKEKIRDVSEIASKEQSFERILNKMKNEWRLINFTLTEFRDTGCPILKGLDPINDKLDEDITKIMSILSSPYIKFLE